MILKSIKRGKWRKVKSYFFSLERGGLFALLLDKVEF